jgi:putative adhesin
MFTHGLRRLCRRSVLARPVGVASLVVVALGLSRCGPMGPLGAKASDSWTHTYPLNKTGEVTIVNANGRIEVEGVDGSTLEVQAERIASGATEQLARDLLPRIPIDEHASPDFVSIETRRLSGFLIGASYEVRYKVKIPRTATIRATTVNGFVSVTAMSGRVIAQTTNGGVRATEIAGGLEARTVNGGVRAQFASLGGDPVELRTVNGGVRVALPETAKATVRATWVNGGMTVSGLEFEVREQAKRRFEGRLNGGGALIDLKTVNGGIAVTNHLDDSSTPRRGRPDLLGPAEKPDTSGPAEKFDVQP